MMPEVQLLLPLSRRLHGVLYLFKSSKSLLAAEYLLFPFCMLGILRLPKSALKEKEPESRFEPQPFQLSLY